MLDGIQVLLSLAIIALLVVRSGALNVRSNRKLLLDSSGLIDGRILAVAQNGFLADELVVPQFILNELQLIADGHDTQKRERARFGLDIVQELQHVAGITVSIDRNLLPEVPATDDKLLSLSKKLSARLYTTDYNLAKVAAVEGIVVLNVNELIHALRPVALPGEVVKVKIIQKGNAHDQGVGYFEDGTMVVVDGAARMVGKKIEVIVDRMHQTVAGKMVFAHLKPHSSEKSTVAAGARRVTTTKTDSLRQRLRH